MRVVEERLVAIAPRERLQTIARPAHKQATGTSVSAVGSGTIPGLLCVMRSSQPHLGTDVHVRRLVGRVGVVVRLVLGRLDVGVHGGDEHDRDREEQGDVLPQVARTCARARERERERERERKGGSEGVDEDVFRADIFQSALPISKKKDDDDDDLRRVHSSQCLKHTNGVVLLRNLVRERALGAGAVAVASRSGEAANTGTHHHRRHRCGFFFFVHKVSVNKKGVHTHAACAAHGQCPEPQSVFPLNLRGSGSAWTASGSSRTASGSG